MPSPIILYVYGNLIGRSLLVPKKGRNSKPLCDAYGKKQVSALVIQEKVITAVTATDDYDVDDDDTFCERMSK
jgi:hypothetical protein